jgi:hypothetical protein
MRRALYLDFSIPLFEKESDLTSFSNFIKDIARYIDKTNNTKFYVSVSLEFLTTFKSNIDPLMASLRNLVKSERVEFVVRDNFDINSLSFSRNISEFNFILNEYLLGYYFGDKRNFEGDPSIMIKNLESVLPYNGKLKKEDIEFLNGMGYKNIFVDKSILGSSSYIFNSNIFIELDYDFSKLFSEFVEKEYLENYILSTISNNYMVYHVNPYKLFLENRESFNINISNMFHLFDLTDKVEFRFADEYFEMPIHKDLKLVEVTKSYEELFLIQEKLASFMELELPQDLDMTLFDDLRTVSLWDSTGNNLIDEYLRTSFLMLTLLSNSINSKINVLNKHLAAHLSVILDELGDYSKNNPDFQNAINEYRSYINQN